MLTINYRFSDQLRKLADQARETVAERAESGTGAVPTSEPKTVVRPKKIHELDNVELMKRINKIKKDNDFLRRENILFARYLLRVTTSKLVETFDDYENETDIINETLNQVKTLDVLRQWSIKKRSAQLKSGSHSSVKRLEDKFLPRDVPSMLRFEEDRLYIAAYEVEQATLEHERMQDHAAILYDQLKVAYQQIRSDEAEQLKLNRELEQRIENFRAGIGDKRYRRPDCEIPGELFVHRVNRRIQSRINEISMIHLNMRQLRARIEQINTKIKYYDDLTKITEIDMDFSRNEKGHNREAFEELEKQCFMQKAFRSKVYHRLEELRGQLNGPERETQELEKKITGLQHLLERTYVQINVVNQEIETLSQENLCLRSNVEDVVQAPTITNYAYIMTQRKSLQHEIDVWTKRVTIAETILSQLKGQAKPPRTLPPLKASVNNQSINFFID